MERSSISLRSPNIAYIEKAARNAGIDIALVNSFLKEYEIIVSTAKINEKFEKKSYKTDINSSNIEN
jgi:hypothetical protein